MKKIASVAFLGSGSGEPGDSMYDLMYLAGRLCAKRDVTVVTGAYFGSGMAAPARGAKEVKGRTIGFGLLGITPNPHIESFHDCGDGKPMDELSNCAEEQFGRRLARLLMRDAFIIGGDGGVGTVLELAGVVNLNAKIWPKFGQKETKRAAVLIPADLAFKTTFMAHFRLMESDSTTKSVVEATIRVVHTAEAAVDWVLGPAPVQ
ncbi:MAG TPA: hypothetical protein VJI33_03420 [Candidatus Paceibacterota bacterium]